LVNKGALLNRLERYDEASTCFDRALQLDPKDKHAWYHKGWSNMFVNTPESFAEAIRCFEEAERLGHPDAASQIALCQSLLAEAFVHNTEIWLPNQNVSAYPQWGKIVAAGFVSIFLLVAANFWIEISILKIEVAILGLLFLVTTVSKVVSALRAPNQ
jgi:tetratricopeptide (TPR) repeat protein